MAGEAEIVDRGTVAAPQRVLSNKDQKPPIPTLKIRLRRDGGGVVQVYYRGETPGHVDVGDRVRVEGVDRKGLIHAERIYNETTGSWVNDRSRCFVATAVAGEGSREVLILRRFRERRLRGTQLGDTLVRCYERNSPGWAEILQANAGLRAVVRVLLVRPLVWLVAPLAGPDHEEH